jgi:hypothetical protein
MKKLILIPMLFFAYCLNAQYLVVKPSQLPAATIIQPTDLFIINQGTTTKKITHNLSVGKSISDSVAPLKVDITELQADTGTVNSFVRNHSRIQYSIAENATTVIVVGSTLDYDLIGIEDYIIEFASNSQSGFIKVMVKGASLYVNSAQTIDSNGGAGIGITIAFSLSGNDILMSVVNATAETGTIKFTVNNL